MSAIFGLVNLTNQPVARADLERMSAALAHHGAEGDLWVQDSAGLGQRLMRFTPEDRLEQQPRVDADRQCVLVSDARIDNRDELISDFRFPIFDRVNPGWQSKIENREPEIPDSELILRAYAAWGAECVHHLVGVFAFAVWDARAQMLFAARSPIDAPSLFYYSAPRVFAFATMPKGLHALDFIPRALNEEKVADWLVDLGGDPRATLYRDLYRLPTGHTLTVSRAGLNVQRYWQPDSRREIRFPRDEDYIVAFNELFARVIRDHLHSISPVGVMMSGGLDSSSIAATAAQLLQPQGKRLATFTEVPRAGFAGPVPAGRYADETPFIQAIAAMHDNMDLNPIRTDGQTFLDDLNRLFFHLEAPVRNTSNRVWFEAILHQAQRQGVRVLLHGGLGNLTATWNGSGLLLELLHQRQWRRVWREAHALARQGQAGSPWRALARRAILPLLPTPLWLGVEWLRGKPEARTTQPWRAWTPIHPDFAATHTIDARARAEGHDFRFRFPTDCRRARYEALMAFDAGIFIPMCRTMFGVDYRTPLGDTRLAEFCLALPEEQYLRDGEPRALVRRAMADRLPELVLSNRQRGLQAADWFERSTSVRHQIAIEMGRLEECDLARRALDLTRMRRLVEQWPQSGWDTTQVVSEYAYLLERGLMMGRFLRWFETGE